MKKPFLSLYDWCIINNRTDLLEEFDREKNENITPHNVSYGTDMKVWWKCEKGHSWQASVSKRANKETRGCPICANKQILVGDNDLATTHPELIKEWDYDKNELLPTELTYGSTKRVWWKCEKGHSWQMPVNARTGEKRSGCPYCSNKRVLVGENDLATTHPDLIKEWDFEKNELLPTELTYGSTKRVWWKCEKGHSWQMPVAARTGVNKSGCPYCSNKRVLIGENDLATTHPEVAKEWNYEKNGNLTPQKITAGSNKKVWWKCEKGHEWEAEVVTRTGNQHCGCPYCSNQRVWKGDNDLATTHPELIKEWDFEKNTIDPTTISYGKNMRVWWKCEKGHNWQATVASRAGSQKCGCPICANQKALAGYNDFEKFYPELAKEWNYEKNEGRLPSEYVARSNKRVWWKCEKGHEWQAAISARINGSGCPYCAGRQVLVGFNDLQTKNPELAAEWHPTKNGDLLPTMVTAGSDRIVWWSCKYGHEWKAMISSRNRGNGCPDCAKSTQTSIPEKVLAFYLRQQFPDLEENKHFSWLGKREIDIYIPSLKVGVEFDGVMWHLNQTNDEIKDELCYQHGITLIRIRERGCPEYSSKAVKIYSEVTKANIEFLRKPMQDLYCYLNNQFGLKLKLKFNVDSDYDKILQGAITNRLQNSLAEINPDIAKEWNYEKNGNLTPEMVYAGSQKRVWWKCEKGHEWQAAISSRNNGNGCPVCSNRKIVEGINDLQTLFPDLVKEWNYEKNGELKPTMVTANTNKKVWWKCEKGHEWQASVYTRTTNQGGCPYCGGLKVLAGFNDLQTKNPELAAEWHPTKNGDLKPTMVMAGSEKWVWWKCKRGHEWKTLVYARKNGKIGCPYCSNHKVWKGDNDLATTHPELIKEWDFDKNTIDPTTITHGKNVKVWWKCEKGHSWQATVASRAGSQKCGCPICANERKKQKKC